MAENRAHDRYKRRYPEGLCQRIESWTSAGIFDSNWLFPNGYECWVEYKEIAKKKSHPFCSYKIPWRPKQLPWARRRLMQGAKNLELALLIGKNDFLVIKLTLENIEKLKNPIEFNELENMMLP